LYSKYITKEANEWFGDFKIGQVICTTKYADNLALLSEEEAVLQGMSDRQTDTGICYGMEMNIEKTKVVTISRQLSTVWSAITTTQLDNVKYYNYLGSIITNNARCTREIKSRISKEKAAFS
jgi:hypothetical protein